ncbi:hypothetical protein SISNIDRAFT_451916, partial [Sistotremastrum niveocremeum HHB9708]
MPRTDDFEVWIEVDGKRAEEYEERVNQINNEKEKKTMNTCFIPSVAGKNFSVVIQDLRVDRSSRVCARCLVDGSFMFYRLTRVTKDDPHPIKVDRCQLTADTQCFFRFGAIKLSDDAQTSESDRELLSKLGSIQVMFRFITDIKEVERPMDNFAQLSRAPRPVYERKKKGGGHRTEIGQEVHNPISKWRTEWKFRDDLPKTEFTFSYAPEEWLKAKEIIPRSPEPDGDGSHSQTDYPECDFLDEEDAEAFRQL